MQSENNRKNQLKSFNHNKTIDTFDTFVHTSLNIITFPVKPSIFSSF